jgi:hypothetical protein
MLLRPSRIFAAAAALSFVPLFGGPARADGAPTDAELSAARALFSEAEKDEDAQRWSDALEKLQRVGHVKMTPGVRYHTALCEEHLGRLVAALHDYKTAATEARAEKAGDVLRLVDKRVADSSGRVAHLTVVMVLDAPDAVVRIDGQPVATSAPVDADPGDHTLVAEAPGRVTSTRTLTLHEGESSSVEVQLVPAAPIITSVADLGAPAKTTPSRDATSSGSASRAKTLAIASTATAVALFAGGLGAYFAGGAQHDDAVEACAQVTSTLADACDGRKNGVRVWDWVAVGAWAGALAATTVAVVSFGKVRPGSSPGASPPGASPPEATVVVGPGAVALRGSF